MTGTSHLKSIIEAEASRLGFFLHGVTSPAPPPHLVVYEKWIDAGRHASMEYLATPRARAARSDPLQILPQARSIVCLAAPYTPGISPKLENTDPLRGRVAAYALGDDYHDVFAPRLDLLVETLQTALHRPTLRSGYTDTGPLLERDLAQRAGLGWIGKNTCLIHPRYGSYFLLSEILVDAELEPDAPFQTDHCGTCTRCIDACPTGCILPDRTIDAGRCISYQTIENKGVIDAQIRPVMENWIFGCDICQNVCPWNQRFARLPSDPGLAPRPERQNPDLQQELRLSEEAFREKFRGSPIRRAKRRGYLRNVAVALGNSADPSVVPDLAYTLEHEPEALVRAHAAWALGQIGTRAAFQSLEKALRREVEPSVLAEIKPR